MAAACVTAAIALGGNLGDPPATLATALHRLAAHPGISIMACSPLYRSTAIGPEGQPDYANAVILISTLLPPLPLLDILQQLENEAGRLRMVRWGARTLDLDLLLFGEDSISHPRLQVPHPEMTQRQFVMRPLHDIAPDGTLPDGRAFSAITAGLPDSGLAIWPDPRWPSLDL